MEKMLLLHYRIVGVCIYNFVSWNYYLIFLDRFSYIIVRYTIMYIANKWFLGCSYPEGVMKIINKWPAPRKHDLKSNNNKESKTDE